MADILKLESELNKAMMTFEFGSNIKEKKKIQMEKRNKLEKKKRELLLQSGRLTGEEVSVREVQGYRDYR